MRLKSLAVTNQRIKTTCVANIFMLCLLTSQVWSFANIKSNRFARQINDEMEVNYEDFSTTNPYHQPHFTANRFVVVQLFEWKFVDIAAECREFLGPQGYAGVQISPVLEHTVVKTGDLNHPWWERFEVVSYRLASRSGDEAEFWSMSRICNEHGVRIYVDVVLNHMAAPLHYMGVAAEENTEDYIVSTLLETNINLEQLNYSHVSYTHNDFHTPSCMVSANAQDAHVIRNCQFNGHPDLNHSRGNVQKRIIKMLNKFVDMGVAGFRIDKAKYMWPIDLKNIFKQVKNLSTEFNFKKNSRPFVYYDVFDLGLDAVSKTEYSTYGVVSEYLYAAELSTILRGKVPLSSLINWGPALGFLPHEDSLVFIDSPDTQRGLPWELGSNQMLTYKQHIKYIMANVFMLVHPYGALKRIMSSYYFPNTDINQGPPVEEADEEEIRSPKYDERKQCTKESGWVCEHRWPQMVNSVKVANYFRAAGNREDSIIYFQTNGPNQIAFCRGQKAFVAINNEAENDFIKDVYACLEPGMYCDIVTGGKKDGLEECHGKTLEINEQGYIKLELNVADDKRDNNEEGTGAEEVVEEEENTSEIQSYGIVVIYVESKINTKDKSEGEEEINEADANQTQEGKSEKDKEAEDKPSTEEGHDVEGEENNDTDNKEQTDEEEGKLGGENVGEEGDEEGGEKVGEEMEEKGGDEGREEGGENAGEKDGEEVGEEGEAEVGQEGVVEEEVAGGEKDGEEGDEEGGKEVGEEVEGGEDGGEEEGDKGGEEGGNEVGEKGGEEDDVEGVEEVVEEVKEKSEEIAEEKEDVLSSSHEATSSETDNPDGNPNSNDAMTTEEAKGSNEGDLAEDNETEPQTDEENIEVADENGNEGEINADSTENADKEEEDEAIADVSVKEKDNVQQPTGADSVEEPPEHATSEPDQDLDDEPAISTDAGNNQSRNLEDKNTEETEEQIEKPSAVIVDESGDISDSVTAKIQDVQNAGFVSNPQTEGNNG